MVSTAILLYYLQLICCDRSADRRFTKAMGGSKAYKA